LIITSAGRKDKKSISCPAEYKRHLSEYFKINLPDHLSVDSLLGNMD